MRLERLNNLPLNTVTPNFVAIFVFFGTASSFIERIFSSETEEKLEAISFLFGCSEVNSTWLITSELASQRARKVLFTCVVYTNKKYGKSRKISGDLYLFAKNTQKYALTKANIPKSRNSLIDRLLIYPSSELAPLQPMDLSCSEIAILTTIKSNLQQFLGSYFLISRFFYFSVHNMSVFR